MGEIKVNDIFKSHWQFLYILYIPTNRGKPSIIIFKQLNKLVRGTFVHLYKCNYERGKSKIYIHENIGWNVYDKDCLFSVTWGIRQ